MGHGGGALASEAVLYIKRTSDLGYLGLPAGWRPMLLLLVYFCCLEANVFYFGPEKQQTMRMSEKDKFTLLVACCPTRLERCEFLPFVLSS